MLGYLDRNKRNRRKKKSFGGSLYIPKRDKNIVAMPQMENQERRDHMVDTVNHMLIGNTGVGRRTPEPSSPLPNLPSRPRLNLPIQPPNIPQMPLGGSGGSSGAPIEDRPETETDVKFVWTGKPMIENVKRTGRILQKGLSLGAQTAMIGGEVALRGIETGMDAGQLMLDTVQGAMDVADMIRGFTRSRQQLSVDYEDGDRAIEDIPRSSNEPPAIRDAVHEVSSDDEPEVVGDFVDLT